MWLRSINFGEWFKAKTDVGQAQVVTVDFTNR